MDEEKVRSLVRAEVTTLLSAMQDAARSYTSGYDDHTESIAYVIRDVVDWTVRELPPQPAPTEPEQNDDGVTLDEPCPHIYRSSEDAQGNGGASCILCYEREPAEPVDPFAPELTAQQWADQIANLLALAQNDGHDVWIDNRCCGRGKMTLRVGSDDAAPIAWHSWSSDE